MTIALTPEADFVVKAAADAFKQQFNVILRERLLAAIEADLVSIVEQVADQVCTMVHAYKDPMGYHNVLVFEQVIHDGTQKADPLAAARVRTITPQR